jgi:hypothetical protein
MLLSNPMFRLGRTKPTPCQFKDRKFYNLPLSLQIRLSALAEQKSRPEISSKPISRSVTPAIPGGTSADLEQLD